MSRLALPVLLALPVPAAASEYASEPREVFYADEFDAFEAIEFDTGNLPSGSPLAVRFYLKSRGGSYAEMEAWSDVTWPDALTHHLEGIPGTGLFELDCNLEVAAQITFDLWGYKGAYNVWSERLRLDGEQPFDPLLLPGGTPTRVELSLDGDGIDPYEVEIPLFAGLELQFVVDLFPRVTGSLAGDRVEVNDTVQSRADVSTLHDVPEDDPGTLWLDTAYVGRVGAALDVVLRPQMEICAPILGCFRVARFDVPIPLVDEDVERIFEPVEVEHPLPAMQAPVTTHDFGEVEVATLANLQLPLENIGRLDLEGWLRIEGDDSFSVFPEYIQASEGNVDGTVVTFAPTDEGLQSATLVIESNDPSRPELRIPLAGTGWVEPPPPVDGVNPDGRLSGEVRGCGCDAIDLGPLGGAWALGLLGLALVRRRRS